MNGGEEMIKGEMWRGLKRSVLKKFRIFIMWKDMAI